jgi:putative toxin-antitoxin system antitoxin component (TIGR02293 family)
MPLSKVKSALLIGWMSTPVRGLGKCPIDMLETRVETQAVLDLIGRLENGVLA